MRGGVVRQPCSSKIRSIPLCNRYVKNIDFFIDRLCVKDIMATGDFNIIDKAKQSYLLECRRQMDATADGADAAASKQAKADRSALGNKDCPKDCSDQGICTANGCHCSPGFTGLDCSKPIEGER